MLLMISGSPGRRCAKPSGRPKLIAAAGRPVDESGARGDQSVAPRGLSVAPGERDPDLSERDFTARRPNELWVADSSYLRCWEGVVLFSFVIDVYSRKVVGWQFASHMRTDLVLDALRMALSTRQRVEEVRLIHHSDRGSQYLAGDYTQTLEDNDVLGSVGSTGDAYDCDDLRAAVLV
jgi:transposase InsO family protein